MDGFGKVRLKQEGCAIHPDDVEGELTDTQYLHQLEAYEKSTGDMDRRGIAREFLVMKDKG